MSELTMPPVLLPTDPSYTLEVYDVRQAAAFLCVHRSRIYADIAAGLLAHRRDGHRRIRFSQADLDQWRQAKRVEAKPARLTLVANDRRAIRMPKVRRFK